MGFILDLWGVLFNIKLHIRIWDPEPTDEKSIFKLSIASFKVTVFYESDRSVYCVHRLSLFRKNCMNLP